MLLIGIGHRSEHGKDTVANYMVEWLSYSTNLSVIKMPWAWKLKDICHQLYKHLGLREAPFYDTDEGRKLRNIKLPKINLTPVEIWIKMGTPAVRQQVWDDTWIDYVRNFEGYDIVICPDTRFPNEVAVCDYTIKVLNPRVSNREGESVDNVLADFAGWNAVLYNDSGFSELRGTANDLCFRLFPNRIVQKDYLKLVAKNNYKDFGYDGSFPPAGLPRLSI